MTDVVGLTGTPGFFNGVKSGDGTVVERETVWSHDTERALEVGDRVHGLIDLVVKLPADKSIVAWRDGVSRVEIEDLWNRELAARGETTRITVTAFRPVDAFVVSDDSGAIGVTFEVVGRVTHNAALAAWVLVAILVAILVDARVNGAEVVTATGKAVGAAAGEAIAETLKGAARGLFPLALLAGGAFLLWRVLWGR